MDKYNNECLRQNGVSVDSSLGAVSIKHPFYCYSKLYHGTAPTMKCPWLYYWCCVMSWDYKCVLTMPVFVTRCPARPTNYRMLPPPEIYITQLEINHDNMTTYFLWVGQRFSRSCLMCVCWKGWLFKLVDNIIRLCPVTDGAGWWNNKGAIHYHSKYYFVSGAGSNNINMDSQHGDWNW